MDSIDSHSLSDDEMGRLVSIALEEFGPGLNRSQFKEVMLALFEHIAGLEVLPRKRSQKYLQLTARLIGADRHEAHLRVQLTYFGQ